MESKEILVWESFPLRDDYPRSLLLLILLAALPAGVYVTLGDPALVVVALLLPGLSLWRYFLPTTYEMSDDGVRFVTLGVTRARPWSHFRNYYVHDVGIHLSSFPAPSPLDPFRGTFLRFRGNREEVVRFIERRIRKA